MRPQTNIFINGKINKYVSETSFIKLLEIIQRTTQNEIIDNYDDCY